MIPILLYILYKKKGKNISRAAKKVLSKAKARKLMKKAEKISKRKAVKNVYRKFGRNRFNRKRAGD